MTPSTASPWLVDPRGNRLGTASHEAADRVETALWRLMSFFDSPLADLDAARNADPGWALPCVMHAGFLLSLTEPALVGSACQLLDAAEPLLANAPARERAHFEAQRAVADGRWQQACRIWGELLLEHPRDALALQWAQFWDFHRGDSAALRQRPARALPEWSEADPLFPYVLGLYAFGLEENNLYPQAEDAGRRAVAADARVPWAVHAVAQVMEMQGRFEDGAAWLRQHQPGWAEGNAFAGHLWWHMGLFRLEALDIPGVQRLVDAHLSGPALQTTLQRADATAGHRRGRAVRRACARLVFRRRRRRPPQLQRPARAARAAGGRRTGARRELDRTLRHARHGTRGRAPQQPPGSTGSGVATDAWVAGVRAW
jgi:hypothetical protein